MLLAAVGLKAYHQPIGKIDVLLIGENLCGPFRWSLDFDHGNASPCLLMKTLGLGRACPPTFRAMMRAETGWHGPSGRTTTGCLA